MKYRIKITTFENGRKVYIPQVKTGFISWEYIHGDGYEYTYISCDCKSREKALDIIDNHYNLKQRNTVKSIEIEYITK
jgi:hypothetical protein